MTAVKKEVLDWTIILSSTIIMFSSMTYYTLNKNYEHKKYSKEAAEQQVMLRNMK